MANCKNCGGPLTKGNIKVVRPRGKKRPYRVCRRCPPKPGSLAAIIARTPIVCENCHDRPNCIRNPGDACPKTTAGRPYQRPQDSTGGPLVAEGVLEYSEPPRYRYFVTRATAEKLQRTIKGGQVGVTVEVLPVPDYQVEANPDALGDYIEITMKGGINQ